MDARKLGDPKAALLPGIKPTITFKCEKPLPKIFTGEVDLYSVDLRGLDLCDATQGYWLGVLTCGHTKSLKTSEFLSKDVETYQILGIARKRNKSHKLVIGCSRIKTYAARLYLHFCDPVILSNGTGCVKEACPLSLQIYLHKKMFPILFATSQLDKNHTATHAWLTDKASLRSFKTPKSSWCALGNGKKAEFLLLYFDYNPSFSISAISTQGAVTERSWVSSYIIYYRYRNEPLYSIRDENGQIKELKGNTDPSSIVRHWVKPHMYASIVLLYPTSYVGRLCMSVELYGCRTEDISMLTPVSQERKEQEEPIRCNLPKQPGNCKASFLRWFYNRETKQCEPFSYGGCKGNLNNFWSEDDCRKGCPVFEECKERCNVPFSRCVKNNRSEEKCECIQECPRVMKQVCGSDGVTYGNECLLKKAACENNTRIKIMEEGSCTACMSPLGLGNGQIRDRQISASSELDKHHVAKQGRVSLISSPQESSWCSAPTLDMGIQYLQVDLLTVHTLSGFSTQGAVTEKFWVSGYLARYSLNGTDWILIEGDKGRSKEFKGNTNQSSIVHHWLKPRLKARLVRFSPTSFVGQRCMRVELYGCKESHLYPNENSGCNKKCSAPFSRCVKHKGNEQRCECIQECPKVVKQVCATDNVTYDNECLLKKTACEEEKELTVVKNGTCEVPVYKVNSQEKAATQNKSPSTNKAVYVFCGIAVVILGAIIAAAMYMRQLQNRSKKDNSDGDKSSIKTVLENDSSEEPITN
ncbi:Neuropilin-1 [Stylophora pistillata]|uniref:Neuropilin-1 n=1 Tax=Stylophora pistillata TaxID=50429 RepID=A0A2B4RCX8_STYPI|nr:Neuropilin-1 [Stylophora pistillata]